MYINIPTDTSCTASQETTKWTNPTTIENTCTHKYEDSYLQANVDTCKNISTETACNADSNCIYYYNPLICF